ncbi:ribonuclease J [Candidatus Woesebacteria bacterium]|nr:ribonuclease J [Candidatus Woesebacteria bacterium]
MSLKFIAISGTTGVTQNCYVYEYGNDMIVVDCGVGFPEPEMYGVDLVIPDFSYIKENKSKLRGIIISHGHEDHMGGLPFLLREVSAPVFATKLVAGFIQDKLDDYEVKAAKINVFDPEKDTLSLGAFKIMPFRVSHSVPDGVGYAIASPEGSIFHVADYKFDWTPVDKRPFDIAKAASLAGDGVLALASDCLGSTTNGYTQSEAEIEGRIHGIAEKARGQIFFTTISSNISRIQQALNVAKHVGRKVVFVGRSIDRKAKIAANLGYLNFPPGVVISNKEAANLPKNEIMYFISGSYGQPGSALYRVSLDEHEFLKIKAGDVVIFSSDPAPPGSKANVDFVVDRLFGLGADVNYYDMQEDLHVSGHGSQEDIKMLIALTSPKYFIPIGGTVRHMKAYSIITQEMGSEAASVFELMPGSVVEFSSKNAKLAGKIPVKDILVDGLGIGDVGNVVLRDRQILAKDGIAIVLLQIDRLNKKLLSDPEVISRGFVFEGKTKGLLIRAGRDLRKQIERRNVLDAHTARDMAIDFLEKFFYRETGRRPMILPVIVEV